MQAALRKALSTIAGRHWIVALAMVKAFTGGILLVSLPVKLDRLGWSDWDLGLFASVGAATYAVACMLYSLVVHRVPLQRVMAISSLLSGAAALGLWVFDLRPLLYVLGAGYWLATAFFWPSLMAWIGESDDEHLVGDMSAFNCAWTVALTAGFVVGGVLEHAWQGLGILLVAGISAGLSLITPFAHIRGRMGFTELAVSPPTRTLLPRRFLFAGLLSAVLVGLAVSVPSAIFVKLNSQLGYTANDYGTFFGLRGAVQAFVVLGLGVFQGWRYRRWPLVASLVLAAAGSALLALPLGHTVLAIGFMLLGAGMGIGYTTGFYYSVHGRSNRKRGAGLFEATLASQAILGGPLGGALAGISRRVPYIATAAIAALGAFAQVAILKPLATPARLSDDTPAIVAAPGREE